MFSNPQARLVLVLMLLTTLSGCQSEADDAYGTAYKANYEAYYSVGLSKGKVQGEIEGQAAGSAEALTAAQTGSAWQLYWSLALGSVIGGLLLGLVIQYGVLLACRWTGRPRHFSAAAFVPAMKSSVVYAKFKRERDAQLAFEEQFRELYRQGEIRMSKMLELKRTIASKLETVSDIEELSHLRLLELAAVELDRIASASESKVETDAPMKAR